MRNAWRKGLLLAVLMGSNKALAYSWDEVASRYDLEPELLQAIAANPQTTAASLRGVLSAPHGRMPDLHWVSLGVMLASMGLSVWAHRVQVRDKTRNRHS